METRAVEGSRGEKLYQKEYLGHSVVTKLRRSQGAWQGALAGTILLAKYYGI